MDECGQSCERRVCTHQEVWNTRIINLISRLWDLDDVCETINNRVRQLEAAVSLFWFTHIYRSFSKLFYNLALEKWVNNWQRWMWVYGTQTQKLRDEIKANLRSHARRRETLVACATRHILQDRITRNVHTHTHSPVIERPRRQVPNFIHKRSFEWPNEQTRLKSNKKCINNKWKSVKP